MRSSKTIIQTGILTTILFINTGCFFSYFNDSTKSVKPLNVPVNTHLATTTQEAIVIQRNPTVKLPVECSNDLNAANNCQKKPIEVKELHPKEVNTQGGEVHKLRSIQGKKITIIERSNGFIFPESNNKIVILQMFGKNCSHCIKEIPIMRNLYKKYFNNLDIIAIQVEDKMSRREAKSLLQKHRIKYSIVPGEYATNLQYNIQSTYGWSGILPYTLMIKDGVTEFSYPGEVSYKEISNDLKSLL